MLEGKILNGYNTIALAEVSTKARQANCAIANYLDSQGYEASRVFPIAGETYAQSPSVVSQRWLYNGQPFQ